MAEDEGMPVSGPVLVMHWLVAVGTLLLTVGSALQAAAAIAIYRTELEASGLAKVFSKLLDVSVATITIARPKLDLFAPFDPFGVIRELFRLVSQIWELAQLAYRANKRVSQMIAKNDTTAIRMRQLINVSLSWLIIMYSAFAVLAASVIQLVLDYLQ